MREIFFRGKRKSDGKWLYGHYSDETVHGTDFPCISPLRSEESDGDWAVIPETVGEYTGLGEVWEHDIVDVWGKRFEVVKECGTFGIVSENTIDYELFKKKIKEYTGCDNTPCFCYNDNFISLWELYWNYNEEENNLFCVEVIGNIHDNPELLEG